MVDRRVKEMTSDVKDWGKEKVEVEFTNEELAAAINLLDFSLATFASMAQTAQQHDDLKSLEHIQVRMAFAKVLATKLINSLEMANGKNKTFH